MNDAPSPFIQPPVRESGTLAISLRTAFILLLFTLVFTALMAATYEATRPVLEETARQQRMKLIDEILPPGDYDNDLLADVVTLPPLPELGLTTPGSVWRARRQGEPVALIFEAVARQGYGGEIRLILALRADGTLAALRVTAQRETPGLGDYIDPKKDKDRKRRWIDQFSGQPLALAEAGRWKVKKDGGVFDARAGATISARAVTGASREAMLWAGRQREALFGWPRGTVFAPQAEAAQ